MSRAASWSLAVAMLIVLLVAVFLVLLDWKTPWFKGPIAAYVGGQLGRDVMLSDELDLDLGGTVRLHAADVRIANADWASEQPMLVLGALEASLDLAALLRGETRLPRVALREPHVLLERREDGTLNWDLGMDREEQGPPPAIEDLAVADGQVVYRDAALDQSVELRIGELTGSLSPAGELELQGAGRFEGQNMALRVHAAQETPSRDDWRVDAQIELGKSRLSAKGTLAKPDMTLEFHGPDLATLNDLPIVDFPHTAPVDVVTRLTRRNGHWLLGDIRAQIGPQKVSGDVRIDADQEPIMIYATLHTDRLHLPDRPKPKPAPERRLIPAVPIETAVLHKVNVQANLSVEHLEASPAPPLRNISLAVSLERGRLTVEPIKAQIAAGRLQGGLVLDGRERIPSSTLRFNVQNLRLDRALAGQGSELVSGRLSGRVELSGHGRTLADLLKTSDGQVLFVVRGGEVQASLVELMGLDLGEWLVAKGADSDATPIRCGFIAFNVDDGIWTAHPVVLDTRDSVLVVDGHIDLSKERLDLTLRAHPKDASVLAARAPIHVRGPLRKPSVQPEAGKVAAKGAAALALGALLTPLAALLPLSEPGTAENVDCNFLLNDAVPPPKQLPKGKKP